MDRLLAIIQTVTGFIGAASVVGAAVLGIYSSVSRKNKLSLTSRKPVWQWIIGCITILLVSTSIYYLAASQSPVNVHPPSTGTQRSNSTTTIATPTPSPKPTQPSYPRLATIYQGTIANITVNARSTLALTSIVQNQSQISGNRASQVIWVPLLNIARFLDDPKLSSHIVDLNEYFVDLEKGTLPEVAYIAPSGASEHPPGGTRHSSRCIRRPRAGNRLHTGRISRGFAPALRSGQSGRPGQRTR